MSAAGPGPLARAFRWTFRNRITGEITIGQTPNLPLIVFAAASAAAWMAGPERALGAIARIVAQASLAWWAADELMRGVNPWRRCLGLAVLVYLAATFARS